MKYITIIIMAFFLSTSYAMDAQKSIQEKVDEYQFLDKKCINKLTKYRKKVKKYTDKVERVEMDEWKLEYYTQRLTYWDERCNTYETTKHKRSNY